MPDQRPPKNPSFVPAFLLRLRARRRALDSTMPSWLRWNVAVMLLAALGFGVLLWILSPILAPFLAAVILAYIFDPLVTKLQARGISRTVGAVVAILVLLLAVALLLLIVLPLFYKELAQLFEQIPNLAEQLKTGVLPWLNEKLGSSVTLDPASFRQFITDNMSDASGIAKRVFASIGVGGVALVGVLINLLLIPIVFFYVLRDWPVFVGNIDSLLPRAMHSGVSQIVREIDAVLSEFLRGQISVMLIMAVFYVVGLSIAGLDFALPVGLITGLLVFIPYLGSGSGLLLGTIAAFMQFPTMNGVVYVWIVFAIGQLLEGFLITPWLVGNRIGLHPVAVLFALLAFGQVFGFFGVLMALPASAAILIGLRHLQARYRSSGLYLR